MQRDNIKAYMDAVERDFGKLENRILHIEQERLPDIYDRISKISGKISGLLMFFSINLALLGFILYKLFDLVSTIQKVIK
jgi:hypothetical protein